MRAAALLMALHVQVLCPVQREFFIGILLVRIYFIIVMLRWTGLAPWEFEFPLHPPAPAPESSLITRPA